MTYCITKKIDENDDYKLAYRECEGEPDTSSFWSDDDLYYFKDNDEVAIVKCDFETMKEHDRLSITGERVKFTYVKDDTLTA